ncbi:hypothetical protein QBC47DRAFT_116392 [Echria macrotheca]|uniref:Uncharacterized protein n=1 Tax=Echria macrotheca TaxID=438768 RepID=A0AAJ0BKU0_9PEZI|nr:hypothetical protein QBC47DRAFT_116392 [Echria macrotheca]
MSDDSQIQPDWSQVTLSDEYTWTDGVSKNGRPYKIGIAKTTTTSNADEAAPATGGTSDEAKAASKSSFNIAVNWSGGPPTQGFAQYCTPTDQEKSTTSIQQYLLRTGPAKYNEFSFSCTESYNFWFTDKTGDSYQCNVFWARPGTTHYFSYFSSDPTIMKVTGS